MNRENGSQSFDFADRNNNNNNNNNNSIYLYSAISPELKFCSEALVTTLARLYNTMLKGVQC